MYTPGLANRAWISNGAARRRGSDHACRLRRRIPPPDDDSCEPRRRRPSPRRPTRPPLLHRPRRSPGFSPARSTRARARSSHSRSWDGHVVARIAHLGSGVVLMSFDQSHVRLRLHSGTTDAGPGFRFGPAVTGTERSHLLAGFNGGFRLSVGAGGFEANGHVAVPLRAGLGSVVTYSDGTTDVGSWHQGVPARGKAVVSVRQNLQLLIDHGHPAGNIGCVQCWGATLGGVVDPARAALGVDAAGNLIWAAGEHLDGHGARAGIDARARRAGGRARHQPRVGGGLRLRPPWCCAAGAAVGSRRADRGSPASSCSPGAGTSSPSTCVSAGARSPGGAAGRRRGSAPRPRRRRRTGARWDESPGSVSKAPSRTPIRSCSVGWRLKSAEPHSPQKNFSKPSWRPPGFRGALRPG